MEVSETQETTPDPAYVSALNVVNYFVKESAISKLQHEEIEASLYHPYRHTLKVGDTWIVLTGVTAIWGKQNSLKFHFWNRKSVSFQGDSFESIATELACLIKKGFCNDCGDPLTSKEHVCKNLLLDSLNPREDLKCTICLEPTNGATRMQCGHAFHYTCLVNVYADEMDKQCPTCRLVSSREVWDLNYPSCDEDDDEDYIPSEDEEEYEEEN
jgi:hypothetical protein